MTKSEFMSLMKFPDEWSSLGMYPDELFQWQLAGYKPGHEAGAEHDRNGAFHWWLRRNPSKLVLKKLLVLASLDPDGGLGTSICTHVRQCDAFDSELGRLETELFGDSEENIKNEG